MNIQEYIEKYPDMKSIVVLQLLAYEEHYGEGVCIYEIAETPEEGKRIYNLAIDKGYEFVDENAFGFMGEEGSCSASILIFKKNEVNITADTLK